MNNNHYIFTTLSVFILLCCSSIFLSIYSNPYNSDSLFSKRPSTDYFGGTRTSKAIQIIEGNYDAFILGSSRSEIGINPKNKLWGDLNTYNASLAGSNLIETYKVFQTIIETGTPKLIVLALDYSLFSPSRSTSADFNLSRFDNTNNSFTSFFKEHLSKESIEKSIRKLKYIKLKKPPKYQQGQKIGSLTFNKKIKTHGQNQLIFDTLTKKVIGNPEAYSSLGFSDYRMQLLQNLIQTCSDKNIELILFISPVHALQLMTFKQMGIWENFLNWKKKLTHISRKYPEIPLYDFTDLNLYITETLPVHKSAIVMPSFWETSHYKETLGDHILNRVLNSSSSLNNAFGTKLNQKNITEEIAKQRFKLNSYEQANKKLLVKIQGLIKTNN